LCDLVCVQVGQRLARQVEMKDAFLGAAPAAGAAARKRTARR
jgi:hypothetical protein